MGQFFPLDVLKQANKLLFSKTGVVLIGINFVFFLCFGFITFLSGLLILAPAAMLLKEPQILSGILVFILALIFIEIIIIFIIIEQYVILVCLNRHYNQASPIFELEMFKDEKGRFVFYIKATLYALLKICVGLVFLIVPGVKAFLEYLFVGPIAIFEYKGSPDTQVVLDRSEILTKAHLKHLGIVVLGSVVLCLLSSYIMGQIVTQLVFYPLIATYFTVCVVILYREARK